MRYRQGRSGLYVPSSSVHNGNNLVVKFHTLTIWAEEGLVVYTVDCPGSKDHGSVHTLTPDQAQKRFAKVMQSMGKSTDLGMARDAQELRDMRRVYEGLEQVIRKAREQTPKPRPKPVSFSRTPKLVWDSATTLVVKD